MKEKTFLAVFSSFFFAIFLFFFINHVAYAHSFTEYLYQIFLNGQDSQRVLSILKDSSGNLWVESSDLKELRIVLPKTRPILYDTGKYYLLHDVPGLNYKIEEAKGELYLFTQAKTFEPYTIDLYQSKFIVPEKPHAAGGILNYSIFAQKTTSSVPTRAISPIANGSFEVGIFNDWGTLSSNFLVCNIGSKGVGVRANDWRRLNTSFIKDNPKKMQTLVLGDAISTSGLWGRAVSFVGWQWKTNYAVQPYFHRIPLPIAEGTAALPSTLEAYVGNILTVKQELQAGPFQLENIPVIKGRGGDVNIIVTDILGRQQIITVPYYSDFSLLKTGLREFAVESGFVRTDYGFHSFNYSRFMVSGTDTYGITDSITRQFHTELTRKTQNVGISYNIACLNYGLLTVAGAGSHGDSPYGSFGGLGVINFNRGGDIFSYGLRNTFTTSGFRLLGMADENQLPVAQHQIYTSFHLPPPFGSLGLSYTHQRNRNKSNVNVLGGSYNFALGRKISAFLSFSSSIGAMRYKQLYLTVHLPFDFGTGAITTLSASNDDFDNKKGFDKVMLQTQKNVPNGKGYGYRLGVSKGQNNDFVTGGLIYNNDYGTYSADIAHYKEDTNYRVNISGGMVMMKGKIFISRRVHDSFAIVNTGYPDLPLYLENNKSAITNKYGYALVSNAWSYAINHLKVNMEDLPFGVIAEKSEIEFTPYRKSGLFIDLPVEVVKNATLTLRLLSGEYVPIGASVKINDRDELSVVGAEGEFYATRLMPQNKIIVSWDDRECIAKVLCDKKPSPDEILNLGTFVCYETDEFEGNQ